METETVITQQPNGIFAPEEREWTVGLFGCCTDIPRCFLVTCCPLCYLCHLYKYSDEACGLPLLGAGPVLLRVKHRFKHHIKGSLLKDVCATTCCPLCTMCQLKADMVQTKTIHQYSGIMTMSPLIKKLSELRSLVLSDPTDETTINFFSGEEWFELSRAFQSADRKQKDSIISILDEMTVNRKGAKLFGIEVFIPTLYESLIIKRECEEMQGSIFRIISRITLANPCVDYGNSFPTTLMQSVDFLCDDSSDVGATLSFIDALLTYAISNCIDIHHSLWSLLDFCADKCTKPDSDIWKFLILSAKLLPVLPTQSHGCLLPRCLQRLADFAVKCLQTNNLMNHSASCYSLFEFLLAITRFCACSLSWLRPLCLLSKNRGEPFAVLLSSVIVELRLRLPCPDLCSKCKKPCEGPDWQHNWINTVVTDLSELNNLMVDRAAKLLIFALREMDQAGSSEDRTDVENQVLAEYLEDEAIEKFWLQLCDLGRVFSDTLSSRAPELTNALMSDATISPTVKPEERLSEPTLLLVSAYLKWIVLYYETNRSGILSMNSIEDQTTHLSQLIARLVEETLTPISSVLWPILCAYFTFSNDNPLTSQLREAFLSFALLLQSFPDLAVFSPQFSWKSESFIQILLRWIVSNWDSHFSRRTYTGLTLLHGALIAASSVMRQIHDINQDLRDHFSDPNELSTCEKFLLDVCKTLATSEKRFTGKLLPLYTEFVILTLRTVVQGRAADSLIVDEIFNLAHLCLSLLDDDPQPFPYSPQQRLSQAIDIAISGTPGKSHP
ncbi:unnamed protein product [Dicrocoelium dendriticum]|nr:unnamed protein product [Dicrocoelium dendriticum]